MTLRGYASTVNLFINELEGLTFFKTHFPLARSPRGGREGGINYLPMSVFPKPGESAWPVALKSED